MPLGERSTRDSRATISHERNGTRTVSRVDSRNSPTLKGPGVAICRDCVLAQRPSGCPTTGWGRCICTMLKTRHQVHTRAHNASDTSQSEHVKSQMSHTREEPRNGFSVTVWYERSISANERLSHHQVGLQHLHNTQTLELQLSTGGERPPRVTFSPLNGCVRRASR